MGEGSRLRRARGSVLGLNVALAIVARSRLPPAYPPRTWPRAALRAPPWRPLARRRYPSRIRRPRPRPLGRAAGPRAIYGASARPWGRARFTARGGRHWLGTRSERTDVVGAVLGLEELIGPVEADTALALNLQAAARPCSSCACTITSSRGAPSAF